jgi:hypothetical protein
MGEDEVKNEKRVDEEKKKKRKGKERRRRENWLRSLKLINHPSVNQSTARNDSLSGVDY